MFKPSHRKEKEKKRRKQEKHPPEALGPALREPYALGSSSRVIVAPCPRHSSDVEVREAHAPSVAASSRAQNCEEGGQKMSWEVMRRFGGRLTVLSLLVDSVVDSSRAQKVLSPSLADSSRAQNVPSPLSVWVG
ncbi:hypothetical protein Tdes44962_MAKER01326 [Teratosphaeria destructans]|uniref:Uncharacterized protein n=1 Tax=Teratosphaeria destructans TaxID=418781 RepID=A0A9W7T0J0_9PEZI|nr:hypothetical protein Tdes44962_MAKER01326 [Teratosphaeria destructans]